MITTKLLTEITTIDLNEIKSVCAICDINHGTDWDELYNDAALCLGLYACLKKSGLDQSYLYLITKYIKGYLSRYDANPAELPNLALLIADNTYCAITADLVPYNFKEAKKYTEEEAKSLPQPLVSTFYSIDRLFELLSR